MYDRYAGKYQQNVNCTETVFSVFRNTFVRIFVNRGSYNPTHVLLNLLNKLRKKDKMRVL